ncbi:MAG: sialate O-acetylesterase [Victivallaceae bacterium]|nr:sialate O-acetylesterase [Victivallaceae bacterium]
MHWKSGKVICACAAVLLLLGKASADEAPVRLTVDKIFGPSMVLQQGREVILSGTAPAGKTVRVTFRSFQSQTLADASNRWHLKLPAMTVGDNDIMTIECGTERRVLPDVAVGEVWICIGQSNMAMILLSCSTAQQELAAADRPNSARIYLVNKLDQSYSGPCVGGMGHSWQRFSSKTTKFTSAIACIFARKLSETLKIPIGVIDCSFSGTQIETWLPMDFLEKEKFTSAVEQGKRVRAELQSVGAAELRTSKEIRKKRPYDAPGVLYDSMLHPFFDYPVAGVLFYQGESNAKRHAEYEKLFRGFVKTCRQKWNQPELPFLYVQLSAFGNWKKVSPGDSTQPSQWAAIRQAQRNLLDLPRVGMVVSLDVGDTRNIHPKNKEPIAERLKNEALRVVYPEKLPAESAGVAELQSSSSGRQARIGLRHDSCRAP